MIFTRTQIGYSTNGQPLFEYALAGTSLIVCRTYPDRGRDGWTVYDEDTTASVADAWHLADAKALAIRHATNKETT